MPEPDAEAEPGALDTVQTSPAFGDAIVDPIEEVMIRQDLIHDSTLLERSYEKNGSDTMTAAAVSLGGWGALGAVVLLVLLAVSAYLYSRQSGKDIQTPETKPLVQVESKAPPASTVAPQVDVAVTPIETPRPSAVDANTAGQILTAAPPSAGIVHSSSGDTEAVTRLGPPPKNECVPALVTLGLCNPEDGQERP